MFFWFIGTAIVTVGWVFRDPAFDYRLLIVGSVLPVLDGLLGGVGPLHSLTVSVVVLAVVMIGTSRRSPTRRLLLGLPIGMILHLVFDAAWTDTDVFWWPFTGLELSDADLPILARGGWSVVMEVVGLAICGWLWRENAFNSRERRRRFLADGRLTVGALTR